MGKSLKENKVKKKVVIFDIDYTVFNTHTFRANLYEHLSEKLEYTNKNFFYDLAKHIEKKTRDREGYFKPRTFIKFLKNELKTDLSIDKLEDIFFDESLYIESLYEDARSVFQELVMKRDIPIIIFSTGEKKFQMYKLSGLKHMLQEDQIHIFVDKLKRLKDILSEYKNYRIYMVDDLPTVLKEAKQFDKGVVTIWVNRDRHVTEKDFVKNYTSDFVISSLTEVTKIVSKN